jgi:DNA-binding transcriptional LysR family regulator
MNELLKYPFSLFGMEIERSRMLQEFQHPAESVNLTVNTGSIELMRQSVRSGQSVSVTTVFAERFMDSAGLVTIPFREKEKAICHIGFIWQQNIPRTPVQQAVSLLIEKEFLSSLA